MKNILLLTDFSDTSKNAIRYALQFFEDELCTFHVLYVQDSTSYTTDDIVANSSSSLYNSIIGKHQKKLIKYVATLEAEFDNENFNFKTIVDFDSLIEATNQAIKSKKIELVVMGTNGATGAKEIVFGSNTINVIRNIKCKTLIVPGKFEFSPPKTMLLPLDPFDALDGKAMRGFSKFVETHHLMSHVLRINPGTEKQNVEPEDKHDLNYRLKNKNYVYHLIDDVSFETAVDTYIQTHNINIMSLFVQKETLLERLFIGSSTTKINKKARVPLLVLHS